MSICTFLAYLIGSAALVVIVSVVLSRINGEEEPPVHPRDHSEFLRKWD